MKVLITGGAGFIGQYFGPALAAAGRASVSLDLAPAANPAAPVTLGDVRDRSALETALAGCDAVLHLAAAHHDFGITRDTFFSVNEEGARTLTAAMDAVGVRELCFSSTVAVYGDAPPPYDETKIPAPNTPYGASKLAGEAVFRAWTERGEGRRCLVIRPTVTFGPGNFANMYSLIREIDRGRFLRVGQGTNIKSLSYVENLVAATLYLWSRPARGAFEVFNYIDKPDLTSGQIVAAVYEDLGKPLPKLAVPYPIARALALPFDAVIAATGRNLPISSARLKKLVLSETRYEADKVRAAGFVPPVDLREGIRRMVAWYQASGKSQSQRVSLPPPDIVRAGSS
ncbi:MAG: NAD(P)-dependent oxidoreductase [Pirellulales bacterium]